MNNYSKLPTDIDGQLAILRSRGMLIDDVNFAYSFLKEHYFYQFLNYSVAFFNVKTPHNDKHYLPGTKFSDVVRVYNFDSKLRLLILEYIEQIEIAIKTQFVNLSWKYGPHFYLNRKLFKDTKLYNDSLERIEYQARASSELLISEYFTKYNSPDIPPVWTAVELMSIGQLAKWYGNLKYSEDKELIARHFNVDYTLLHAILENFTLIRNYSAHYARIWNRHYDFSVCNLENKYTFIHELCSSGNGIYTILLLIIYMIKDPDTSNKFMNRLIDLIELYSIDVKAMGFQDNWRDALKEAQIIE